MIQIYDNKTLIVMCITFFLSVLTARFCTFSDPSIQRYTAGVSEHVVEIHAVADVYKG